MTHGPGPSRPRPLVTSGFIRETIPQPGGMRQRQALVNLAHDAIRRGSKSFAAASRLFDRITRERAWLLYAWCRRCDDLADDQDHGGALGDHDEAHNRIKAIRVLTTRAMEGQPTADPAFDSFGLVSGESRIPAALVEDVIAGFALDADGWRPRDQADLMRYCYHVAGAVGVMMALVMGIPPDDEDLLDRACDLGIAFQLANIARDIAEDDAAGRCYLPLDWLAEMGIPPGRHMEPSFRPQLAELAARLAELAQVHEDSARIGARRLRFRQRWAVLSAAEIYGAIARKVQRLGPRAWDRRVSTSALAKLGFVTKGLVQAILPPRHSAAEPEWRRPRIGEAGPGSQGTMDPETSSE